MSLLKKLGLFVIGVTIGSSSVIGYEINKYHQNPKKYVIERSNLLELDTHIIELTSTNRITKTETKLNFPRFQLFGEYGPTIYCIPDKYDFKKYGDCFFEDSKSIKKGLNKEEWNQFSSRLPKYKFKIERNYKI